MTADIRTYINLCEGKKTIYYFEEQHGDGRVFASYREDAAFLISSAEEAVGNGWMDIEKADLSELDTTKIKPIPTKTLQKLENLLSQEVDNDTGEQNNDIVDQIDFLVDDIYGLYFTDDAWKEEDDGEEIAPFKKITPDTYEGTSYGNYITVTQKGPCDFEGEIDGSTFKVKKSRVFGGIKKSKTDDVLPNGSFLELYAIEWLRKYKLCKNAYSNYWTEERIQKDR